MIIVRTQGENGDVVMIGIDTSSLVRLVAGQSSSLPITVGDTQATVILFAGETDQTLVASVRQIARDLERPVVDIGEPPSAAIN